MIKSILHIALLVLPAWSFSQKSTGYISQKSAEIGEKITLTYQVELPQGKAIQFRPEIGFLPCKQLTKKGEEIALNSETIEILTAFRDTIWTNKNKRYWQGGYEITIWDEGTYRIEGPTYTLSDSTYSFPDLYVDAQLVKSKKEQELYDIKEHFSKLPSAENDVLVFLSKYWWLLLLLPIGFGIYYLKKYHSKKSLQKQETTIPLEEKAQLQITNLEHQRLWEKEQLKEHYSSLSGLLRNYLSERYGIELLEKTTEEAKLLLRQKTVDQQIIEKITHVLTLSDLVKFAKSNPDEINLLKSGEICREIITETSRAASHEGH
jgi:hypothetical protein